MTALSTAFSDAAQFVDNASRREWRRLRESAGVGIGTAVYDELVEVWEECREHNWDGYDAAPIEWDTYNNSRQFLDSLPLGVAAPSVGAEADGDLTFEWYRNPKHLLSVSVSAEGELHYAASFGRNRHHGTFVFSDEAPRPLVDMIRRACAK